MSYYDDDRWEFDPEGERGIEPDPTGSSAVDDGGYERGEDSLEDDHMDYPDTPGPDSRSSNEPTEERCECGAPLNPGRTKCDFYLTNDLEYEKSADADTDREVTGAIHVLVDASSEANAVCIAQTVFEDLAEDLDVSVTTVSNHLSDLEEKGVIQGFTPRLNYDALGFDVTAVIQLKAEGDALIDITDQLHNFKQITNVYEVTGDYDVIVVGKFTDTDEMNDQIKALLTDPDINESNTSVVLNAVTETEQFELTVEDE